MRSRMSPTGHVPLADLPDRQYLLGSSRGSCNKNITYTTTYSHHYIRLYTFIYIHIKPYIQVCISFIPMSIIIYLGTYALMYSCTSVLMYSCTRVLMYSSRQRIWYCYCPASISTKKHIRIYTTYVYIYILSSKETKISNTPTGCPHPRLSIV